MEILIENLGYDAKRKMVEDDFTTEMSWVVERESNIISEFLRAQTIMKELDWTDQEISKVIEKTCKYGYMAFEIIYSDDQTQKIGLNELDPSSLIPGYNKQMGNFWTQYKNSFNSRILLPAQVIYLSNENSFNEITSLLYQSFPKP